MKNTSNSFMISILHGIEHNIAAHADKISFKEIKVIGNPLFNDLAKDMELDLGTDYKFVKFPLFLTKAPDDEINVCSVCFGALSLMVKDDAELYKVKGEYLNAAINALILLHLSNQNEEHNQEAVFWPRNYYLGTTQGEAGTLNQTSLSLSTLATLGFLNKKSPLTGKSISNKAFKSRLFFILKGIKWILDSQKIDALGAAWSYATTSTSIKNEPISTAVLPTFYCIKTLDKYLNIFKRDNEIIDILKKLYPNILLEMEESIKLGVKYLVATQNHDGGIGKNNVEVSSSYMHSILALQILVTYGANEYEAIGKYLNYITKVSPNVLLRDIEKNIFEKCRYQVFRLISNGVSDGGTDQWIDTYDTESFEICPECMIIISGIDILEYIKSDSLKNKKYAKYLCKLVYFMYMKLLKRIVIEQNNVYIKGRRTDNELEYPIYCLYYGKKSIKKLLKYDGLALKKLLNRKITFDRWLLIICFIAVLVISISILVDSKATIIAGLTTLFTSLITFILKKVKGD